MQRTSERTSKPTPAEKAYHLYRLSPATLATSCRRCGQRQCACSEEELDAAGVAYPA